MEIIQDPYGNDVVLILNEDGSQTSMLKSTYDEMIARNEANPL
jgi:hypothetical protein